MKTTDVSDQTVTLPPLPIKNCKINISTKKHQKPHNDDFLFFRWLCMSCQINKRKRFNAKASLRQFYVASVSGVFTSHFRFMGSMDDDVLIYFDNALGDLYSRASYLIRPFIDVKRSKNILIVCILQSLLFIRD